ncbi:MAG: 3-deoxy-manno-octulosonate cytidylyltransferase [Candidatus Methylacidiphilales bacterium]|nr:3-deoxy-manno-octulosonate cytidylyltransferase [Candidatus Methylacidiphilales bacterium]
MSTSPRVWAVIPARYASSRFPGKMLADIQGKPLIQRVWERVRQCPALGRITIATDDERIARVVEAFGGEAVMTDPDLPSGTDRVAAVIRGRETGWDWILNVQGDEPMITPDVLQSLITALGPTPVAPMATMARRITDPAAITDPNVVKVVSDLSGRALYFSRSPIPHVRDPGDRAEHWHHLGLYVYRPDTLQFLVQCPPSPLELAEKLEQLRALQNGVAVQVVPTSVETIGVDRPEDVQRVAAFLRD